MSPVPVGIHAGGGAGAPWHGGRDLERTRRNGTGPRGPARTRRHPACGHPAHRHQPRPRHRAPRGRRRRPRADRRPLRRHHHRRRRRAAPRLRDRRFHGRRAPRNGGVARPTAAVRATARACPRRCGCRTSTPGSVPSAARRFRFPAAPSRRRRCATGGWRPAASTSAARRAGSPTRTRRCWCCSPSRPPRRSPTPARTARSNGPGRISRPWSRPAPWASWCSTPRAARRCRSTGRRGASWRGWACRTPPWSGCVRRWSAGAAMGARRRSAPSATPRRCGPRRSRYSPPTGRACGRCSTPRRSALPRAQLNGWW